MLSLSLVLGSLAIDDLYLLAHRLLVDGLEDLLHEVAAHVVLLALLGTLLEDLVVAAALVHGDGMLALELTYLASHAHASGQLVDDALVALIDLFAQEGEALGRGSGVADDELLEELAELQRGDLL